MRHVRSVLFARASFKRSDGQVLVLVAVFMTVLIGAAGLVLDVGSWYRADRATQATADASALAGAQGLIVGTSQASALADEYATKNGGGSIGVSFGTKVKPNDLITVRALLWVETESQKGIVIGSGGSMVKAIGSAARVELERELGSRVHLDLSVRVRRSWRADDALRDRLGIT